MLTKNRPTNSTICHPVHILRDHVLRTQGHRQEHVSLLAIIVFISKMISFSAENNSSSPKFCAVVRQCIFYEKYGGCKFGKDCFYAHNDEMTLGVRNAMQMAQQMGKGGIGGGGVEIRFDERCKNGMKEGKRNDCSHFRENEVKMVRVVETFPAGNERERGDRGGMADRNGFGRGPGYGGMGGGRGRFMGRGRGNFRGGPM